MTNYRPAARRGNWLLGCGIVLVIVVLLVVAGGVFVARNARSWAASGMEKMATAMIEQAPIGEEERAETLAVLDGFTQDFRDGKVTVEQLIGVMEQITKSPLLPAGVAMGIGEMYFAESALTEEEKAQGRLQLTRIARGMADGMLVEQDLRRAVEPIVAGADEAEVLEFRVPDQTSVRLKGPGAVTPDELRAFIGSARSVADERGVAPEPDAFDYSGELRKAIDAVLDGSGTPGGAEDLPQSDDAAGGAPDAGPGGVQGP